MIDVPVTLEAQWYREPDPFEPSARGAGEIRRVCWNVLRTAR
jgi:hypothetical protein